MGPEARVSGPSSIMRLFSSDSSDTVGIFAASNIGLAGLNSWLANLEPILHSLVSLGQVAVAAATVIYILKKVRAVTTPKKRKRK